jgi:hypothetical protein
MLDIIANILPHQKADGTIFKVDEGLNWHNKDNYCKISNGEVYDPKDEDAKETEVYKHVSTIFSQKIL